jgi:hypothetical protein
MAADCVADFGHELDLLIQRLRARVSQRLPMNVRTVLG